MRARGDSKGVRYDRALSSRASVRLLGLRKLAVSSLLSRAIAEELRVKSEESRFIVITAKAETSKRGIFDRQFKPSAKG